MQWVTWKQNGSRSLGLHDLGMTKRWRCYRGCYPWVGRLGPYMHKPRCRGHGMTTRHPSDALVAQTTLSSLGNFFLGSNCMYEGSQAYVYTLWLKHKQHGISVHGAVLNFSLPPGMFVVCFFSSMVFACFPTTEAHTGPEQTEEKTTKAESHERLTVIFNSICVYPLKI